MKPVALELLSPAKNLECGIAAIDHGADAVYIGAPAFSARAAAHNSLADIRELIEYAHQFGARVYVALNTLLDDRELEDAVRIIDELYRIHADAVIIQDVGLLECELAPIALHASTQMNNRTLQKVRFLEDEGFAQVVLARELSLPQIRGIRATTSVPLEFFVHGALCVSYSGQCYISEVMTGRSANRGECAQFCRHRYTVTDKAGKVLAKDKYLLSLKDLDLSLHLDALINAGISSFKIEGRLKDIHYVKNVTARYRQLLDAIIDSRADLVQSSSGVCNFGFVPDAASSFSRGQTDYYLHRHRNNPAAIDSPKSIGKKIGKVIGISGNRCHLDTREVISNGDGLCFFDGRGELVGFRVNRADGNEIHTRETVGLKAGTILYRNNDVNFNRALEASSGCRKIRVRLTLTQTVDGLVLAIDDEDDIHSTTTLTIAREVAARPGIARQTAERQLNKSGGTIFWVEKILADLGDDSFYPTSAINEIRRLGLENHRQARIRHFVPKAVVRKSTASSACLAGQHVGYTANIRNEKAAAFFRNRGAVVDSVLDAEDVENCALMTTRYCVRKQLELCPNEGGGRLVVAEPLVLTDNTGSYELVFHCTSCEMTLHKLQR